MSNAFDFTKFVPGFDFLKNLTPGAAGQTSTAASGWVAPTLDPQELEKRIQELKTVHFWLDQNTKAVGATIQAMEVQRMTLETLKGMNLSFSEMAESLKIKPVEPAPSVQEEPAAPAQATQAAPVDPSQWWGALTHQFQHIANKTMNDLAHSAAAHAHVTPKAPKAAKKAPSKTGPSRSTPRASAKTTAKSKR
jgi:hypothetical protein